MMVVDESSQEIGHRTRKRGENRNNKKQEKTLTREINFDISEQFPNVILAKKKGKKPAADFSGETDVCVCAVHIILSNDMFSVN